MFGNTNCKTQPAPLSNAERKAIHQGMRHHRPSNRPIEQPSDTWDWVTADDLLRVSMKAFQRTRRTANAATREQFAVSVAEAFRVYLAKLAVDRGLTGFDAELTALASIESVYEAAEATAKQ